jgi:putative glutathione S-transferase
MFDLKTYKQAFDDLLPEDKKKLDFYPTELRKEVDELNGW